MKPDRVIAVALGMLCVLVTLHSSHAEVIYSVAYDNPDIRAKSRVIQTTPRDIRSAAEGVAVTRALPSHRGGLQVILEGTQEGTASLHPFSDTTPEDDIALLAGLLYTAPYPEAATFYMHYSMKGGEYGQSSPVSGKAYYLDQQAMLGIKFDF